MGINFETLKTGFREYLESKYTSERDQEKLDKLLYSDKSIFMMSDEFQDYVKGEYNLSFFDAANLLDVLKEKDIEEQEAIEKAGETGAEEPSENEVPLEEQTMADVFEQNSQVNKGRNGEYFLRVNSNELNSMSGIVSSVYGVELDSDEGKAISEQLMAQNPRLFKDGVDSTLGMRSRIQLIDATNILGLKVPETISMDSMDKYSKENGVQFEDAEFMQEILNELLSDSDFKSALGLSKDGQISDKELKTFFDSINSYDSDNNVISVKDVLAAVEDIGDGVFRMKTEKEIEEMEQTSPETIESQPAAAPPASGQQGVSSVPSSYMPSGSAGVSPQRQTHDAEGNPILENMTKAELEGELEAANTDVTSKQTELNQAQADKEANIGAESELKKAEQEAYEEFASKLSEENREKLDAAREQIESSQTALDENAQAITEKNTQIAGLEAQVANFTTTLSMLNSQKSALESTKNSLTSSDSENAQSKIAEIEAKITALEAQISEVEGQKTEAENELNTAKSDLGDLETQKTELQNALDEANQNMTAVEDEIVAGNEQLQALRESYDQARADIEAKRAECDEAIATAQSNLEAAQAKVRDIEAAISQADTVKDIKENYTTADGSELIELAKQFEGMSESQVESVCGYNLPDGLWCAAFVKYIATEVYGSELPSWYTNCNYNSCSEILNAAKQNDAAFTDPNEAQAGDMIIFNTGRGQARHIGYVVKIEDGVVYTIEGNSGSKVSYRTYDANDTSRINSYVRLNV